MSIKNLQKRVDSYKKYLEPRKRLEKKSDEEIESKKLEGDDKYTVIITEAENKEFVLKQINRLERRLEKLSA